MKKSLVLTGMMGVGKSTIGKLLSIRLKMRFVDIDRIIENQEKMLVKDIFEKKGEQYFRKLEEKKSMEILEKEDFVIALGGGAFVNDNIRTLTIKNCISFWLNASTETLLNRNSGSKKRPLLKMTSFELTPLHFIQSLGFTFLILRVINYLSQNNSIP